MSTGVPNVVTVLKKLSSPPRDAQAQRDDDVARGAAGAGVGRRRVGGELVVQGPQRGVAGDGGLAGEALEQVGLPLAEVRDPRGEAVRVQARAQDVHRRCEQVLGQARHQHPRAAVVRDERPAAVDGDGGVGVVAVEDELDRLVDGLHLGLVERALLVDGRVAGGEQEPVALAQRDLQLVGEVQHHVGARLRAARLDEAEVARGHPGLEGEVELAEAAPPAPVPQEGADGGGGGGGHGASVRHVWRPGHYPRGNGFGSPAPSQWRP